MIGELMKKLLAVILSIVFLLTLVSCKAEEPETEVSIGSDPEVSIEPAETPAAQGEESIPFQFHEVGTFYFEDSAAMPGISVITSAAELDAFFETYGSGIYLGGGAEDYGRGPWLTDLCEEYDDTFFAEKDLIIFHTGGAPSEEFIVTNLSRKKNEWIVNMDIIVPFALEDAFEDCLIVIETDTDKTMKSTDANAISFEQNVINVPDGGFEYAGLNGEYAFSAQTLYGNPYENGIYPKNTAITSSEELAEYIEENREIIYLGGDEEELTDTTTFLKGCEKYDDAFFAENDLIVCFINYPPTCTPIPKVTGLSRSGPLWEVSAEIEGSGGAEAEGNWLLVIETDTDKTMEPTDTVMCFLEIMEICRHG